MAIDGRTHAKRVDAGEHLQRLLRGRLQQTAPETSGPTTEIGRLGGLAVTAQAITTIEDEVRVAIPDAHIEVSFLNNDLSRTDPANLITRLERQLHRLPDTIADLGREVSAARAEAQRAEARIGAPWARADELAGLRHRQKEIEEQLAATAEPPPGEQAPSPETGSTTSPQRPAAPPPTEVPGRSADVAAAARMSARLDTIQHRSPVDPPAVGL